MNISFSGGSQFTGQNALYHQIMMLNELCNGYGAYQLSWAGTKNSGLSIGGNQIDLAYCDELIVNKLTKIIAKHVDLSPVIVEMRLRTVGKSPQQVFYGDTQDVQNALVSEEAVLYLNSLYEKELTKAAKMIDRIVDQIDCKHKRGFYGTSFGRCLLMDYHNQFNINPQGKFMKMVNKACDYYSYHQHYMFIMSLKYSQENKDDMIRRLKNIIKTTHQELFVLDQKRALA